MEKENYIIIVVFTGKILTGLFVFKENEFKVVIIVS